MANARVLITSFMLHPGDQIEQYLLELGFEVVWNSWHGDRSEDELMHILQGMNGAIVSTDPFTRKVFEGARELKVVSRTGVGYDAIDVPAATEHGIAVCITPGTNNVAVAEYAFGLMLAAARRLIENHNEVIRGGWTRHQGRDLAGSTLGIIGLGNIGKELARRARAFDMKVIAFDPIQDIAFARSHGITYVPLDDLYRESDFVSLHLFLDAATRHIVNAERLALMKPRAYLINTSRGGTVDQDALYQALKERRIAGAALDVFEHEPLETNSHLRELDNVYLAPHVAGQTFNTALATGMMAAESVVKVLKGERPSCAVNARELGL